jgi:hypothetical protein
MKNFKIKLILLVSLVFFTACSSVQTTPKYEKKERVTWRKMEGSVIVLPLEAGDIIIKEKTANPIGMFGHVAIMKDDRTVVDYPKFGNKSYTIDISYWLEKGRDILVLRYKDMDEEFKKRLVRNMEKYFGKNYKITTDRENIEGFYCSQYIWYVYYITAKEMGYDLDLDSDGGSFVMPYDFINSPYLEIID